MNKAPFIAIYPKAAPDEYCDRMIESHNNLESSASGCKGEEANGGLGNRKDVSFYFERDNTDLASETNQLLDRALKLYMDEHPALGMQQFYSNVVKVQRTPPKGGFHVWHCERGSHDSRARVLVWMIYLNDCPEGEGTTEFLEHGVKVQPEKGTIVLFPADWTYTHRGNPVYSHDKYIATGWYYLND
jgi:hypothetical protein